MLNPRATPKRPLCLLSLPAARTQDSNVFSFLPGDAPCEGLHTVCSAYRDLVPAVRMAGPTSFAPAIIQAMRHVVASGGQYHILLIVADGQVTRPSDMLPGQLSTQEQATVNAIMAARWGVGGFRV